MDRYTSDAARASGFDDPTTEDVPEHALVYIRALERLAHDLVTTLDATGWPPHREPLAVRARALLDLPPPKFNPATEGP